jgi:hypothetical protein
MNASPAPRRFRVLQGEALAIHPSPYGRVGDVYRDSRIEVVWVEKQDEEIEPGWFSQPKVDLLIVLQGELKVEFERADVQALVMKTGDVLILPAGERCRAYRWPRDRTEAAVFLAVYPAPAGP